MTAEELLTDLQRQGFMLTPLSEGKLAVKPADRLTDDLRQHIHECKAQVLALLRQSQPAQKEAKSRPFLPRPLGQEDTVDPKVWTLLLRGRVVTRNDS